MNSKILVPGTETQDDDIIDIAKSPPSKRSKSFQSSDSFEAPSVYINPSDYFAKKETRQTNTKEISKPAAVENEVQSQTKLMSKPAAKTSLFKRKNEVNDDDDFSLGPNKSIKNMTLKPQNSTQSQSHQVSKKISTQLSSASSSSKLFSKSSTNNKRLKDNDFDQDDDTFMFKKQKVVIRSTKIKEIPIEPTTSSVSLESHESNLSLDLQPGREANSTKWLSKPNVDGIIKTEDDDDEVDTVTQVKSFNFPSNSNDSTINRCTTKKEFKKKKNFKQQSNEISMRFLVLEDANLLHQSKDEI